MDTLTMIDRGDCCPAQARVLVGKRNSRIMFCHHHYNKNSEALLADGWEVLIDDRSSLIAKSGAEVS